MAVNKRTFSRILAESTGDRIGFAHSWDIEYSGKSGVFAIGATITDGISGLQGLILKDTIDNAVSTSGVLSVSLLDGHEDAINSIGATISGGGATAVVVKGYSIYTSKSVLFGFNNPTYGQYVNIEGEASVTFAGGSPQFDAHGKMRVSNEEVLAEHVFNYSTHTFHYTDILVGGASSITHLPDSSGVLLSTGTASGDKVERITDKYYKCQAGKSLLIETVCAIGDEGKDNVFRYWGYGDEANGIFFRLQGTTMRVQLRSSVTGTKVEINIDQADWNHDNLNGTGDAGNRSNVLLDVSKVNVYWIDIESAGGGHIRMGISVDGKRILCHDFSLSNASPLPALSTATLPVHFEQENFGVAASSSEMRLWSSTVKTEGKFEPPVFYLATNVTLSGVTARVPLVTLIAGQTYNSLPNRMGAFLEEMTLHAAADVVLIEIVKNATLTGGDGAYITAAADGVIWKNITYTGVSGGVGIYSTIVGADSSTRVDLSNVFHYAGESLSRKAIITDSPDTYTIVVTPMNGISTTIHSVINWVEVR